MDRKNIHGSLRRNNTPIGTSTSNHMSKKSSQIGVASTPIDVETRRSITSGKCKAPAEEHHEDTIDSHISGAQDMKKGSY